MRHHFGIAVAALMLAAPLSALSDAHEMPTWMAGNWYDKKGDAWSEEYWTPLRADTMFGFSRSGTGDTLNFWEQMRLQREDGNAIALWIVAADQKPVRFEATASGDKWMTFENPAHDYPQRIAYWREGRTLKAKISMMDGSKPVSFRYSQK
jgi:hypothetical protein